MGKASGNAGTDCRKVRENIGGRAVKKIENVKNTLNKFIWLLPPLIVCAAMTFLFKVNGLYPFTGKTIAWCDMDQQVIPLLLDFKDILAGKEGLFSASKTREA